LARAILPLTGNARPQTHLKVSGGGHRLKAANQFAQTRSFRAKASTWRANRDVCARLIAQLLVEFRFVNFSPRSAAFFPIHHGTTWM
jgi:hypothetical protein